MTRVETRRHEFMKNVWNHSEDPFQTQFDDRPPLSRAEISELNKVVISALNDTTAAATTKLGGIFRADDNILALSLQLVGLTRNKILQDLKAAARSGAISVKVPSSYSRLPFTSVAVCRALLDTPTSKSVFVIKVDTKRHTSSN